MKQADKELVQKQAAAVEQVRLQARLGQELDAIETKLIAARKDVGRLQKEFNHKEHQLREACRPLPLFDGASAEPEPPADWRETKLTDERVGFRFKMAEALQQAQVWPESSEQAAMLPGPLPALATVGDVLAACQTQGCSAARLLGSYQGIGLRPAEQLADRLIFFVRDQHEDTSFLEGPPTPAGSGHPRATAGKGK